MKRRAYAWSTRLIGVGLGIWVAALLLPGLDLAGPPARQLLVIVVAAVVVFIATVAVPIPLYRLMRRLHARVARRLDEDDSHGVALAWWLTQLAGIFLQLAVLTVLTALSLGLVAWTGLGLTLAGVGPAVVAALVVAVVWPLVRVPFYRRRLIIIEVATVALTMAALGLALAVSGGVRLESGPGWAQVLTVAVLALIYHLAWLDFSVPFLTLVLRLLIAGLKLWLLSWLNGWLVTPLRIEGFWNFVLAAFIVVVLTWPLRLAQATPRAYDPGLDALERMELHRQMTTPPLY